MTVVTAKDTRVESSLVPDTGSSSTLQTQNLTRYQKLVEKRGEDSLDTVQVCGKWISFLQALLYRICLSPETKDILLRTARRVWWWVRLYYHLQLVFIFFDFCMLFTVPLTLMFRSHLPVSTMKKLRNPWLKSRNLCLDERGQDINALKTLYRRGLLNVSERLQVEVLCRGK